MTNFDKMAAMLPCAATLAEDGAMLEYLNDVQNMKKLSRLLRKHSELLPEIAAAAIGKPLPVVQRQHFLVTLKELPGDTLTVLIRLIRLCAACRAPLVARTLYAYRPETDTALALLLHAEIEQQEISLYACDMLRLVGSVFLKDGAELPSIRELLNHKPQQKDSRTGAEIVQDIFAKLSGMQKEEQPNADDRDEP